jgi:SWI/SNF related-matrix-associated actin-dependent regulator of chromatin subfamily C
VPKSELSMEVRRNIYESNGKESIPADKGKANGEGANGTTEEALEESLKEEIPKKFCHSCGNDCTRRYYHHKELDICPTCRKSGEFPSRFKKEDFTLIENKNYSIVPDREDSWTDEEELHLLEALEMYDDDWNKIADYVRTRTREECVNHFLQAAIEDDYMEPELNENALGYLGEGRLPFTQLDNPVLSVMTYLAGLADPSVTAAAVGRSVAETERVLRQRIESGKDKGKDKATEGGAVQESTALESAGDAMEIEQVSSKDKLSAAQAATALPFAMVASRANALASHEERSLTRLIHMATNMQMQKLELKLLQFSELEHLLKLERKDLERRRQALFLDRLEFQKRMRSVEETFERAMSLNPVEGAKLVKETVSSAVSSGALGVGKKTASESEEIAPLGEGDAGYKVLSI